MPTEIKLPTTSEALAARKRGPNAPLVKGLASEFLIPGTYYDLDPEVYQGARLDRSKPLRGQPVSKSLLCEFSESPWRWRRRIAKEESRSLSWGNMVDIAVLTPERFTEAFVVCPEAYQNAKGETKPWNNNATVCKQWNANQAEHGREVVSAKDIKNLEAAVASIDSHAYAEEIMKGCKTQVAMVYERYVNGWTKRLPVTGLIDILPDRNGHWGEYIVDLKTIGQMEERKLSWHFRDFGYDVQAALYLDLWNKLNPEEPRHKFAFIIQSSAYPFETGVIELDDDSLAFAQERYNAAMQLWVRCVTENDFPSKWEEPKQIRIRRT